MIGGRWIMPIKGVFLNNDDIKEIKSKLYTTMDIFNEINMGSYVSRPKDLYVDIKNLYIDIKNIVKMLE